MELELPLSVLQMAGIKEMNVTQIGIVDLSDVDAYGKVSGLIRGRSIGLFRINYHCAEKWTLSVSSGESTIISFISFGVGRDEKSQLRIIDAEVADFCMRHRDPSDRRLAVLYYCSNGYERRVVIVAVR